MGGKYLSFIVLLGLLVVAMAPANAGDAAKSGKIERNGSKFSYRVIALTSKNRRIEVTHSGKEYTGALGRVDSYLIHSIVAAIMTTAR
ncbi:UNVERIFIED_ORG: hypothetical protein GGD44_002244 [Rhizobium esperanzae]